MASLRPREHLLVLGLLLSCCSALAGRGRTLIAGGPNSPHEKVTGTENSTVGTDTNYDYYPFGTDSADVQQAASYCVARLNYDCELNAQVTAQLSLTTGTKLSLSSTQSVTAVADPVSITYTLQLLMQHSETSQGTGLFNLTCVVMVSPDLAPPDDYQLLDVTFGDGQPIDVIAGGWEPAAVDDEEIQSEAALCVDQLNSWDMGLAAFGLKSAIFSLLSVDDAWTQVTQGTRYNLTLGVTDNTSNKTIKIRCYMDSFLSNEIVSVFLMNQKVVAGGAMEVDVQLEDVQPMIEACVATTQPKAALRPAGLPDAIDGQNATYSLGRVDRAQVKGSVHPAQWTIVVEVDVNEVADIWYFVQCTLSATSATNATVGATQLVNS